MYGGMATHAYVSSLMNNFVFLKENF